MYATAAVADVEAAQFDNAKQESLYAELVVELRCLVCANQSLSDSNADLAKDLRAKVRQMVADGRSRDAIIDYMVARYGDYVLYRPRLSAATWFLWFAPFVAVVAGLVFIWRIARRKPAPPPRSEAQLAHARALLRGEDQSGC